MKSKPKLCSKQLGKSPYKKENRRAKRGTSMRKDRIKFQGLKYEKLYNELYKKQGGRCAICKRTLDEINKNKTHTRFCIDHDHATGEIRGLLCNHCNLGLGYFCDDRYNLAQAIEYLSSN